MKKAIILGLLLLIVGLIVGYLIFGKIGKHYIPIDKLLGIKANNWLEDIKDTFTKPFISLGAMRTRIIICGGVGLIVGILLGLLFKEK